MNPQQSASSAVGLDLKRHFLEYQRLWSTGLLISWALANTTLLITTELMEAGRSGRYLPWWEPFSWEVTSISVILILLWPIVRVWSWMQSRLSLFAQVIAHCLLTLPFSLIHVTSMVALRKLWYWGMGQSYDFGHVGFEFLYEYRKDVMTYFILVSVIGCYRFIVRRLQGEATDVDESENSPMPIPDRLLIKKLGKEFLISVSEITWVEACGNYANLHVKDSVFPMRITMTNLEARLPEYFCRVHRSYMINTNAVDSIEPLDSGDYKIHLRGGEKVPLSRRYRDACKARLSGVATALQMRPLG